MNNSARRYREYKQNLEEKILYNGSTVILGNTQITKSERLIAENTANLIFEALDKDEFKKATKLLKKLGAIKEAADKNEDLKLSLSAAIQAAEEDVNSYTGGGLGAMFKRLKGKLGGDNPLVKSLTLLSSLETGFAALEDILTNNNRKYKADNKDAEGKEMSPEAQAKAYAGEKSEIVIKNTKNIIAKAFQPAGAFAKLKSLFGSSGGLPYLENVKSFVDGLMNTKPSVIKMLVQAATTGASAADVEPEKLEKTAGGDEKGVGGSEGKKSDAPGAPAVQSGIPITPNNPDAPAALAAAVADITGADADAAVEKQEEKPASFEKLIKFMRTSLASSTKVDQPTVDAVVDWLVNNKELKTESKFYVSNLLASKRRNIVERWQVLAGIPVKKERSSKVMTEQYRYNDFDRWSQIAGISRLSLLQEGGGGGFTTTDNDGKKVSSPGTAAQRDLDATNAAALAAAEDAPRKEAKEIVNSYQEYYGALAKFSLNKYLKDDQSSGAKDIIKKSEDNYRVALEAAEKAFAAAKNYTDLESKSYKESVFTKLLKTLLDSFSNCIKVSTSNFNDLDARLKSDYITNLDKDREDEAEDAKKLAAEARQKFDEMQKQLSSELDAVKAALEGEKKKGEKQDPGAAPENYKKTITAIKDNNPDIDDSDITLVLKALEDAGLFSPKS